MNCGLVVDLFAGGGGASLGIEWGLGRSPDIAINHDPEAIAMHRANHPNTVHYTEDVRKVDIRAVVAGRPVDLLWLSPDCKHHSKAKGGKPVDRRIRGLAWEAVRWAEIAQPEIICLENVQEFRDWGPLDANNRPDKLRKGFTYRRFKGRLRSLGYRVDDRMLRACNYGAPTTRERLFLIAWRHAGPIPWPDAEYAKDGAGGLPRWRTAAQCLDFSLPCPSIFMTKAEAAAYSKETGRRIKRPLKPKTLRRVARGIWRFVINTAKPFVVRVNHGDVDRTGKRRGKAEHSLDGPLHTITASPEYALVSALLARQFGNSDGSDLREPHPVVMPGGGGKSQLVAPVLVPRYGERDGQAPRARSVEQPAATVVPTSNGDTLVAANITKYFGGFYDGAGSQLALPLDTITAQDHNALVASTLTKLKGTSRDGQPVDTPLHTVQAGGLHYAEVRAFLMKYHDNGGQWNSLHDPAPTVVANDSLAMVMVEGVPHVITDIGLRMLTPRELFRCQGFPDSYVIDIEVERTVGRKRRRVVLKPLSQEAQVRMCGNSVPPQFVCSILRGLIAARAGMAAA